MSVNTHLMLVQKPLKYPLQTSYKLSILISEDLSHKLRVRADKKENGIDIFALSSIMNATLTQILVSLLISFISWRK